MSNALALVSAAVDLLQLANVGMAEWQKVSDVIGKRIAEGRSEWTDEEKAAIETSLQAAKQQAIKDVESLD